MDSKQETHPHEAFPPLEIARKVERLGVTKARASALTLLVLAHLAGGFISMGALFFVVIVTDSKLGFGITRMIGGFGFCLGLVLVVIAGAELFTGNNLIAMAWASGLVTTSQVIRNWVIVYLGNASGCLLTAMLVVWSGVDKLGGGAVGKAAIAIAASKAALTIPEALARGILCNALVCLAVWLALGGRTVIDKVVAIVFPIAAFVTVGFEHSIANWFFFPWALALGGQLHLGGMAQNLVAVTIGNVLGGTVLVAGVYWTAYLRHGGLWKQSP